MEITKKELEKSQIELTVELSLAEFKPYIEKGVKKVSEEIKIEGFRPGKVPFNVLKQKIGEMTILEEAAQIAVNKTIEKILADNIDKQIVGQPRVDIIKLAPDNPLVFKITLSALPDVKLSDYKNAKVKREEKEIKDEEVKKIMDNLKEMRATEAIVDREAKEGDKVIIDIEMFRDNVPLEAGQGKGTAVILGKDYLIPGFDAKLAGIKKGDTREFDLPYPADHYDKNLAGKLVQFKVKAKEIFERQVPEINDEIAKAFGAKSAEDLEKNIRKNLEEEKKRESEQELEIKIIDKILAKTKFGDIPEVLIDHEAESMLAELEHTVTHQGGKFSDYLASLNKTRDQLTLELLPNAIKRVKSALAIRQIAIEEKLSVDEKEIDEKIEELLKQYKGYEKVEERVKDPSYRLYLHNSLINNKVVEKLKEWNTEK
ncbi:MAG: trigger factor [Patescibacteria group bacterium]|nr:trigger factor [Patescibacteria group bacterium]MDD5294803.1 trigger factor [Patescibacteria group bacterium]MDD5554251.1 trigger factor [Patescibacteria group bacterium]